MEAKFEFKRRTPIPVSISGFRLQILDSPSVGQLRRSASDAAKVKWRQETLKIARRSGWLRARDESLYRRSFLAAHLIKSKSEGLL